MALPDYKRLSLLAISQSSRGLGLVACLEGQKINNMLNMASRKFFGVDKVTFMAMQLSSKGIQPSQQKVDAVKYFKTPSNVSEVKSFLGLINFLARFTPNLATEAEPSDASHA
jgi:hypothetical protein